MLFCRKQITSNYVANYVANYVSKLRQQITSANYVILNKGTAKLADHVVCDMQTVSCLELSHSLLDQDWNQTQLNCSFMEYPRRTNVDREVRLVIHAGLSTVYASV